MLCPMQWQAQRVVQVSEINALFFSPSFPFCTYVLILCNFTLGAEIVTNATVKRIITESTSTSKGGGGKNSSVVKGVQMQDGSMLYAKTIISATTPYHTFMELMGEEGGEEKKDSNIEKMNMKSSYKGVGRERYSKALPEEFSHHINHTGLHSEFTLQFIC